VFCVYKYSARVDTIHTHTHTHTRYAIIVPERLFKTRSSSNRVRFAREIIDFRRIYSNRTNRIRPTLVLRALVHTPRLALSCLFLAKIVFYNFAPTKQNHRALFEFDRKLVPYLAENASPQSSSSSLSSSSANSGGGGGGHLCGRGHGNFSFGEQVQNSQSHRHKEVGHGRVDGKTRS